MSELNKKIQEYISRGQMTVYQLAKNTGLDRTMIQKMVKGTKYPGAKFFLKFCDALMLNMDEREELIELFRIEKVGGGIYQTRMAIGKLISVFQEYDWMSGPKISHMVYPVLDEFEQGKGSVCSVEGKQAILMHIFGLIRSELMSEEHSQIWIDGCEENADILTYIYLMRREHGHEVEVNHHLNLSWQRGEESASSENIKVLISAFPALFALRNSYKAYYSYVHSAAEDRKYTAFRHYLVVNDKVILFNEECSRGLFVSDAIFVSAYRSELEEIRKKSRPLFRYTEDPSEVLQLYEKYISKGILTASYEKTPSLSFLYAAGCRCCLDENAGSGADGSVNDSHSKKNIAVKKLCRVISLHAAPFVRSSGNDLNEDVVRITGVCGAESFLETGRMPGLYGDLIPVYDQKDRIAIFHAYADYMENATGVYMLQDLEEASLPGVRIELYSPNKVVMSMTADEADFGLILLEENSAYEAFLDYFRSMVEYEEVRMPEEAAEVIRRITYDYCERCAAGLQ